MGPNKETELLGIQHGTVSWVSQCTWVITALRGFGQEKHKPSLGYIVRLSVYGGAKKRQKQI